MKLVGLTAALFTGVAHSAFPGSPVADFEWMAWKSAHGFNFPTRQEEAKRFSIFNNNRQFVAAHNARAATGVESYTVGMNKYAAMEHSEFEAMYLSNVRDYSQKQIVLEYQCPNNFVSDGSVAPSAVSYVAGETAAGDVRVTSVKDQGSCGSCWTFGTGAAIEGALCAAGVKDCNTWTGVSTQQFVDCASYTPQTSATDPNVIDLNPYDNHGCSGGFQANNLRYTALNGGVMNWDDYPYVSGTTQTEGAECLYDASKKVQANTDCGSPVSNDEAQLVEAVAQKGVLTIAIDAGGIGFQLYSGGVYSSTTCSSTRLNHAVTLVGYGRYLDGQNYWEVKNSWGTGWGDAGYILIARDQGNMCGVATDTQYAIL
jgi:hypothetical protein